MTDYLLEKLPAVHSTRNNLRVEVLLARKTQTYLIIHRQGKQRLKMVFRAAGDRGDKTEQDLAKVEIVLGMVSHHLQALALLQQVGMSVLRGAEILFRLIDLGRVFRSGMFGMDIP